MGISFSGNSSEDRFQSDAFNILQSMEFDSTTSKPSVYVDTTCARTNSAVVKMCLEDLGWQETHRAFASGQKRRIPHIYWSASSISEMFPVHISSTRETSINKLPGMVDLAHKQNFSILMRRMQVIFPDDYDFYPESWLLPQELPVLMEHYESNKQNKPWYILKPDSGSQGTGIRIADHPMKLELDNGKRYVVQEYIANPILLDGLKFDLRTYVLIRKLEPLEILMSNEGMARFCTMEYVTPTKQNSKKSYMHLTNYSLNKNSPNYQHTESVTSGSKRTMTSTLNELESIGFSADKIFKKIQDVTVKIVIAMMPDLLINYHYEFSAADPKPQCFHILGLDFLLDDKGDPKLLEINASPSLSLSSGDENSGKKTNLEVFNDDMQKEMGSHFEQPANSKVDETIKKPIVLESLILACPEYQILPTWSYLTHFKQPCAVNYPEGVFRNCKDEDTEPILRIIYCHKHKKLDKLRFFEKIAAVFLKFMTCRRGQSAITNRAQSTPLFNTKSSMMNPPNESAPNVSRSNFRSMMSKLQLNHKKYEGRCAQLDLFYWKHANRWCKNSNSFNIKEQHTIMGFNAFLDAFVEISYDCCDREPTIFSKLLRLANYCHKVLGIDDTFRATLIPKPPSLPLIIPITQEKHLDNVDSTKAIQENTEKIEDSNDAIAENKTKLKRENTTGSIRNSNPQLMEALTRSGTQVVFEENAEEMARLRALDQDLQREPALKRSTARKQTKLHKAPKSSFLRSPIAEEKLVLPSINSQKFSTSKL